MKIYSLILFFLLAYHLKMSAQQPGQLGIGFAIASDPYMIEKEQVYNNLYVNKELTQKYKSDNISPFFNKPDYGLFHFLCLEKTSSYFKILVNDSDVAYAPTNSLFYYSSWDTVLIGAAMQRITKQNHIYTACLEGSERLDNSCSVDRLYVIDLVQKDDIYWARIYFYPNCETYPESDAKKEFGWVKWRQGNLLLVDILLLE